MAKQKPLDINRGTTYTRIGTVSLESVLIDLTAATIRFTIKTDEYDADATDASAVVIKNVAGDALGAYSVTIDPADTATLTPGLYYFDTKVELADGSIYKLNEGTILLDGSPTNRLS